MRRLSVYKSGDFYYIMVLAENEMGTASPTEHIYKISTEEDDEKIGRMAVDALAMSGEYKGNPGWDDQRIEENAVKKLGFKSYGDLQRCSVCAIVDALDNGDVVFYSTKKGGGKNPYFEGVDEYVIRSLNFYEVGYTLRKVLNLST